MKAFLGVISMTGVGCPALYRRTGTWRGWSTKAEIVNRLPKVHRKFTEIHPEFTVRSPEK